MRSSMVAASGFSVGSWEAISEAERWAPGPALAMISSTSSSMAAFKAMGTTEALANCMANMHSSSSLEAGWLNMEVAIFVFERK